MAPFYHTINVWLLAAFEGTDTDCGPKAILEVRAGAGCAPAARRWPAIAAEGRSCAPRVAARACMLGPRLGSRPGCGAPSPAAPADARGALPCLQLCPPTGAYALKRMGYGDVSSTASLGVLLAYCALQWALVAGVLRRRYARLRPAQHLGPDPSAGGSDGSPKPAESLGSEASGGAGHKGYVPLHVAEEGAVSAV